MKPWVSSTCARPSARRHMCSLVHTWTCEYPGEHTDTGAHVPSHTPTHTPSAAVPPEGSHTSDIHTHAHIPSLSRKLTDIKLLVTLLSKHAYWQPAKHARTHTGAITSIFAHRDIRGQAHTCAHADTHSCTPGTRRCSRSAGRPPAGGHTEVQVGGGDPARDPGSKELVVRVPAPT